jgi:hypothetical protein
MGKLVEALSEPALGEPGTEQEAPAARRAPFKLGGDWLRFTLVAIEFGLVVLLIRLFALEGSNFGNLAVLAWAGFLVHHFLPLRWRMPFYVALSIAGVALVIGPRGALCVFVGGWALIGVCHLPVRLSVRLGILVLLGGAGVALKLGWLTRAEPMAWTVLASMFMFRLIVYLHDMRHKAAPFSFFRAGAYFFMLPNVCFPMFPVVDYKTFCSTYYNSESFEIYQRGLRWMVRGIIHLLLYRLVYQVVLINPMEVTSLGGVARCMVATYLLYLHVSGQFHLIIGLMHLFGFNLPETHHLYFLAGSFTDLWRRINIYWKDFIMKVFFYPAYFRFKGWGTVPVLIFATVYAFVFTWALHSYQWFWLRGSVLLTWQDMLFWTILTVLVVANILYEAKWGRKRALSATKPTSWSLVGVALRTIGTFLTMTILWTLWSCESLTELRWLATAAQHTTVGEVLLILAGLTGLGVAAVLFGKSTQERTEKQPPAAELQPARVSLRPTLGVGLTCAGLLVLAAIPRDFAFGNGQVDELVQSVKEDRLNRMDVEALRRGYYEELDLTRRQPELMRIFTAKPADWEADMAVVQRPVQDFRGKESVPSARAFVWGHWVTHNRWGMRGPECEKAKAPGTVRIAWLGSSHEYGQGVADGEMYPLLLADQLNRESAGHPHYECLNFAYGTQDLYQALYLLDTKAWEFDADVVCLSLNSSAFQVIQDHLVKVIRAGWKIPFDDLQKLIERAGVDASMTNEVIGVKLRPHMHDAVRQGLRLLAERCRSRGVALYLAYRPRAFLWSMDLERDDEIAKQQLQELGAEESIPFLDLCPAYEHIRNRRELMAAPWDDHTNARGHRLLADQLFRLVHDSEGRCLFRPRTTAVTAEKP